MARELLIHHILAIWDESDHVSAKRSSALAEQFWRGYLAEFPDAKRTTESPAVIATSSPMFKHGNVKSFFHKGQMIPYSGPNKDLAIAKFCGAGFLDQDEVFHSLVDDMRRMRDRQGDPPMHSDESAMVIFLTSDRASGMANAISHIMDDSTPTRCHLSIITLSKEAASGADRMEKAGALVGHELNKRFVEIRDGGMLLELLEGE